MSLQMLREERARIAAQMKALSEKKDWDKESDNVAWNNISDALESVDFKIKAAVKADEILAESAMAETVAERGEKLARDNGRAAMSQFARWVKGGDSALSAAEWQDVRNAMSTTTGTEGGYTVQTSVARAVIDYMKAYGGMRQVANIIATEQGNDIQFPISDGTAEIGEWVGQNAAATSADLTFNTVTMKVFKASSKVVTVPFELLQDSQIDVEALVTKRLGERLGRIANTAYTTGNGTTAPNGIVTAATVGVTAANATSQVTSITYDSIVDLITSVNPAYRRPECKFMMNDASVGVIRKIKDSQGRPLFVPGYETTIPGASGAAPDRLMGYQIVVNQDVAVMAAGAKSIIFGDFSAYTIRDVMSVSMFRFADSPFIKQGQVGFMAWMRTGGQLLDTNAVKLFVNAAT